MPRPAPARDRLLDAAQALVLEVGYSAMTVDAVLDAAGASKGAFFHHFPSKRALGRALVERYAEADAEVLARFVADVEAIDADPAEQLVELVRRFEDAADDLAVSQPGCLFVSFVYERVPDTADTMPVVVEAIELWRNTILEKLEAATAARPLRDEVDLPSLADHFFTTFEGAFILSRATGEADHLRRQLAHLRHYLALLLGVEDG